MFELDTTTRRSHLRSQTRPHLRRTLPQNCRQSYSHLRTCIRLIDSTLVISFAN
jgi:hypothetical protein